MYSVQIHSIWWAFLVLPAQQKSLFGSQDVFVHVAPLPQNECTPVLINCGPGSELCEEDSTSCALRLPQNVCQVLMWEMNTETFKHMYMSALICCDGKCGLSYWYVVSRSLDKQCMCSRPSHPHYMKTTHVTNAVTTCNKDSFFELLCFQTRCLLHDVKTQ